MNEGTGGHEDKRERITLRIWVQGGGGTLERKILRRQRKLRRTRKTHAPLYVISSMRIVHMNIITLTLCNVLEFLYKKEGERG